MKQRAGRDDRELRHRVTRSAEDSRPGIRLARVEWDTLPEVIGDSFLLTQLYQNLLANAMKFTKGGSPVHPAHGGTKRRRLDARACATTASASIRSTPSRFLPPSSACTESRSSRVPVSAWRFAARRLSGTGARFGSNRSPAREPISNSLCRRQTEIRS